LNFGKVMLCADNQRELLVFSITLSVLGVSAVRKIHCQDAENAET
jgi:hypothetical protein